MMFQVKLRKVGASMGVVLPREALAHLKASEGDVFYVTDGAEGGLRIIPAPAAKGLGQTGKDSAAQDRDGQHG